MAGPQAQAALEIPIYQVDAFASKIFTGNPAAVCPLEAWLPDDVMQSIAVENNLSETAFFVKEEKGYRLRWFTPATEVKLCGHATLASGHVVMTHLEPGREQVSFTSRSGTLQVMRQGDFLALDFPAVESKPYDDLEGLEGALGARPQAAHAATDVMAVFEREADVAGLRPTMDKLMEFGARAVIATAPGDKSDFVSRVFAPGSGILEDPVTGSAHCMLVPYWARRLHREKLKARQISARGGDLLLEHRGTRVTIAGHAVPYMVGRITI